MEAESHAEAGGPGEGGGVRMKEKILPAPGVASLGRKGFVQPDKNGFLHFVYSDSRFQQFNDYAFSLRR